MTLALLLAFQALASFDLAALAKREPRCGEAEGGEIIVCGHADADRYRLQPLPPGAFEPAPLRAETGVAGGTLGITTEQVMVGNQKSNRVMVRFKLKL